MDRIRIQEGCAVRPKHPTPNLENLQKDVTKKLSSLNIFTTNLNISMTSGKFPDITIEGVLNTDIWPK